MLHECGLYPICRTVFCVDTDLLDVMEIKPQKGDFKYTHSTTPHTIVAHTQTPLYSLCNTLVIVLPYLLREGQCKAALSTEELNQQILF